MSKFKIGDRIKLVKHYPGLDMNKEYKVITTNRGFGGVLIGISDGSILFHQDSFELVNDQSELEKLIDEANKGTEAVQKLKSYSDQITATNAHGDMFNINYLMPLTFSLKKKEFKPFTVKEGWKVSLLYGNLHIGCKSFLLNPLKSLLNTACNGGLFNSVDIGSVTCSLNRKGIYFEYSDKEHYILSYESAEQIRKALEEM